MLTKNRDPDSIGLMKTKTTGSILALCFFGAALCFADDPQMSPSKPNESKSKVTAGTEKIKPTYISLVQFTDKGIQGADETAASVLLAADMLGNIRTQTMRAFTASEMEQILSRVP
ncbi:MAG: hypothetical protein DMF44_07980 [Verrucomicrobia bacterium]|nr:MAG: hypothetical protein DMF44_07980 [Verrucomicrobiota bacterium]